MEKKPVETSKNRRKTGWPRKTLPWAAAAVVVIGGGGFWLEHGHAATKAGFTQMIRYTTVQQGNVAETVSLSGTLNPANEVTLTGSGTITAIDVKVGQHVNKGQTVGTIDTTSLNYQLQSAEAQLTAAEAQLTQAQDNTLSSGTTNSKSGQSQGQSNSNNANSVAQAQAAVDEDQNQVNQLETEIAAGTVKSPISGTVLEVGSVSGSTTSSTSSFGSYGGSSTGSSSSGSGSTIAVIANLSSSDFIVNAQVAEADVSKLKVGTQATMSLSTDSTTTLTGKVTSISYMPQSTSGVTEYSVTLSVDKPSDSSVKLLPGETVAATTTVAQHNNVLEVPSAAITDLRGQTGVFVQSGNNGAVQSTSASAQYPGMSRIPSGLSFVPVTTGLVGDNMTEIKGGLKAGEQIAVVTQNTASTASTTSAQGFAGGGFGGYGGGLRASGFGGGGGFAGGSRSFSRSFAGQTGGN